MRQSKHVVTQFCFYDRTGIQKMLEKQAAKGWLLDSIGQLSWKYRRIEPKNIRFAVTYYPNASAFDPKPSVGEELYQEFAAHSGWRFVASNAQMQIFCTEVEDPVPIETDPLVELENIHRAVKKSFLPSYFIMLAAAVMNLGVISLRLYENFTGTLANNSNLFMILCWTVLFGMELTEIISYFLWRRKALRAAELDGSFLDTGNRNNVTWVILAVVLTAYVLMVSSLSPKLVTVAFLSMILMLGAVASILLLTKWMKKTGFSREDNRAYTILATVFMSIAVTVISTWIIVAAVDRLPDDHVKDTYQLGTITISKYGDDLPLTVKQLTGEDDSDYSSYKTLDSSILIDRLVANQYCFLGNGKESSLRYVVIDVKFSPLLEVCLREYLTMYQSREIADVFGNVFYEEFKPADAAPWGADRAWQLHHRQEPLPEYLLVYGNRIVNFDFSREPDGAQRAMVAQILGNEQNFENSENK